MKDAVSFHDWIKIIFDHPIDDHCAWYFELDANVDPVDGPTFIQYTTELFRASAEFLRPYSDAQVNQGLNVLISNGISNSIFALKDEAILIERRTAFLRAIFDLNRECFEPRCTPHLSHRDRDATPSDVSALNAICYMWWDIFIIYGATDDPPTIPLHDACLWVMENSLQLSNPAVLEGALHGLGHWTLYQPQRCEKIIDDFLRTHAKNLSPELQAYASAARTGCIQ
ncbi:MAG TPA: hypothetical protein VM680_06535 [Verrucomicrobiae bacterium]|nr:hypothetical protein [Verrucomicrobiae bacterium]